MPHQTQPLSYACRTIGIVLTAGVATCVQAQVSAPEAAASSARPSGPTTLQAVEITATRRPEPIKNVPMQVDVLQASALTEAGAKGMRDYLSLVPGVSLNSAGAGSNQISIRGVTTGRQVGPTVGVYVDDVPFGSATGFGAGNLFALNMGLLDLSRIEVLRGPQGTLYGAGSMGGLMKYVTNSPDAGELSGLVGTDLSKTTRGGWGNTVNAQLNVPLQKDVMALRVSAFNDHDGGFVDSVDSAQGRRVNRSDTTGARVALGITPSKSLNIQLTAMAQNINRHGNDQVDYDAGGQPVFGDLKRSLVAPEPFHQKIQLVSANIGYEFPWARLNSITSYQSIKSSDKRDVTNGYQQALQPDYDLGTVTAPFNVTTRKVTQEFRLTSPGKGGIDWIAGIIYSHENNVDNEVLNGTDRVTGVAAPTLDDYRLATTYREVAAYGDVTYHFSKQFDVTAGLRVSHNNQNFSSIESGSLIGAPIADAPSTSSDTSKTYLITARYLPDRDNTLYVRIASGYRPGGPLSITVDPLTGLPINNGRTTFDPDTLVTYEAGYKAELWDKRMSLEASVYWIDWKNMQVFQSVNGFNTTVNAGRSRIRGFEFTGAYRPDTQWTLSGSVALSDARITEGVTGLADAGNRLPDTPRVSAAVSADYRFTAADSHPAYLGTTLRYVGQRNSNFEADAGNPNYSLPAYTVLDIRGGIEWQRYMLGFYVKNA